MAGLVLPQIAVTGCGCVSAAGANCETAMYSITLGKAHNTRLGATFFPPPFISPCFLVKEVLPESFAYLADVKRNCYSGLNRTIMLALTAIGEALLKAEISIAELRERRVGIALGTTVGCTFHNEVYYMDWKAGVEPDSAVLDTYLSSNLAGCVQHILGVQGPRAVITNACASGTDAVGIAKSWLEYGLCDIAIAGGADEISRIACHGFKSLMLVAEESCTPFDRDRRGLNLGEGAGILVLEKEDRAAADGRPVLGWIRGYGIAGDAHHPTAPHPRGKGLQLAITKALEDAGVSVRDISMINGHGTGTRANDIAEANAICELGLAGQSIPVISTKGATGHTLGAAGGVEAVFTLLALNQGELSGTAGMVNADPDLPLDILPQGERVALKGRIGLSQSLAFGGSNGALVIEGAGK